MNLILRNLTEDMVIQKLDEMLDSLDCCKCDNCRLDIASYALNRLPAKYVATTQGELISKLSYIDNDFAMRIITEITRGSEKVKKQPRHAAQPVETLPDTSLLHINSK
jgi:competence protein ComFB